MTEQPLTAVQVRIMRRATAAREYDAIRLVIADMHFSCDLIGARQIRLAKRLADSHGVNLAYDDQYAARVAEALKGTT